NPASQEWSVSGLANVFEPTVQDSRMGTSQRWTLCALCQGYVDPTIASMPFSSHSLSAAAFSSRNLSEKPARPKEIPANASVTMRDSRCDAKSPSHELTVMSDFFQLGIDG